MDAPAAGLRPLLRQAALRPARRTRRPRRCAAHLQADAGLPGAPAALHREPRRAARRRRRSAPAQARAAAVVDVHAAGRAALPRRPVRGPARRASRSSSARGPDEPPDAELRAFYARPAARRRRRRPARGDWRLCDVRGLARQRRVPPAGGVVLVGRRGSRHLVVVNLSDAPAQARSACLGGPRAAGPGSWPTGSTGSGSSATATRCATRACTWRSIRGTRTSCRSPPVDGASPRGAGGRASGPPARAPTARPYPPV